MRYGRECLFLKLSTSGEASSKTCLVAENLAVIAFGDDARSTSGLEYSLRRTHPNRGYASEAEVSTLPLGSKSEQGADAQHGVLLQPKPGAEKRSDTPPENRALVR